MNVDFATLNGWADALGATARKAGAAIMEVYATDFQVMEKTDASPVTIADQRAETVILVDLKKLTPAFPIVAEEDVAAHGFPEFDGNSFWLVDALDGTKDFIKKGNEFTVNIAFVQNGIPVLGVIYIPVQEALYIGVNGPNDAKRAEITRDGATAALHCRPRPQKVVVAGSKSHETSDNMAKFLAAHDVAQRIKASSSVKFCMVAEGKVDLYPRFGPTSEWDTAAGHAIVRAAGGRVHDQTGVELQYKKPKYLNGRFLVESCA
ncbi:MAG: 3'(2'),5'-bisphosphate nucleotidase CysQ [Rhodospirillaceae bacterium]|nr:3'(2'),5'-bisphosphate nucleotidase CysQ [Rhodospirillaceae bacterium]